MEAFDTISYNNNIYVHYSSHQTQHVSNRWILLLCFGIHLSIIAHVWSNRVGNPLVGLIWSRVYDKGAKWKALALRLPRVVVVDLQSVGCVISPPHYPSGRPHITQISSTLLLQYVSTFKRHVVHVHVYIFEFVLLARPCWLTRVT